MYVAGIMLTKGSTPVEKIDIGAMPSLVLPTLSLFLELGKGSGTEP